nr:DUF1566 domain-containing protein [Marinobacter salexigens]
MKAGDDLVLNIGQSGQSLTIKRFFVIDNTISALEFQNGSQLTGAQLFQAFGVTPPATVAQSLQLFAGKADGSPLVGSASPDILIPRMGTKVVQGLSGDDYLIGRIGYGGSISGSGGGNAMEGITFEIEQDSGKKFIIAYEGYNTVYYTSGTSKSDLTYSRMADDLILGNSRNNSEVRVHQFFVRQNTVRFIQFADGGYIDYYELFEIFNAEPPIPPDTPSPAAPDDPFNMVVAGASFDSCSPSPALANAEGYGLTASQLSEANQLPVVISTPGLEAWALKKFEYRVLAADSNNDELCIGLNEAPEGMMVDAPFGLISWEPSRSQLGFHQVEIAVTDERGGQVIQNFEIEVKDPNLPPVIVSAPPKRALEGLSYTYEVLVSDPNDGEPVLEVISGPEGMVATDGDIVWTPGFDHIGVHDIVIRASDIYGASDTQSFQLTVVPFTDTEHLPDGMSRLPMTGYRVPVHPMDDATTQAGTPRVYVRNDLLDIVLDPVNGLIWEDTDNVDVSFDGLNDAARFCQNLVHGGIDTWRLPNRLELVFLLEHHRTRYRNNLINSAFKHTGMEFFAIDVSNHKPLTNYHSTVHFGNGELKPESTGRAHARCVSGEQRFVPDFFRPMEQNVTVDRANRLMWQDDAQVLVSNVAWPAALESCETLELAGHSDWRLPNFNESQTLMQEFEHFVTLENPSDVFLNVPDVRHWASSTPTTTTPGWSRAPYALENLTQFWRFEYQSEIASGLAVNHVHQLPYSQQSNTPVRCVRNYAEPVARIESHPTSINFGESLTLDASSSSDSDGTIISYQWYSLTDDADLGSDPVLHLDSLASGEHSLRLTVTDNNGLTQAYPESIVITVIRPIEIAIDGESSVRLGQNVVLDASGTSGAGGIVSFKWIDDTTGDVVGNQAILNLEGLGAGARNYTLEVIDSIGQVLGTSFEVTVTEVRPIAAVVNDAHTVSEGSSVTLDASESTDADGEIVAYRWFAAGSSELLGDAAQLTLSDLQVGTWSYRLEVEDDSGLVDTKTVSVVVGYEPTVSLDDSHVVNAGSSLTLDASESSDSDGEIVAYRWFADGSTELLGDAAQLALSELPVGTWIYRLEVEDDMGLVSTKAVTIVVGYQPVAVVEDSHVVSEGSSLTLDASGSTDADGEIVAYRWFAAGSSELLGDAAQLTLSELPIGTWAYRLEVEDDSGLIGNKAVTVVVGYTPKAVAPDVVSGYAGTQIDLNASGSSVASGTLAYQWFINGQLISEQATVLIDHLEAGSHTVELVVTTELGLSDSKLVTIEVLGTRDLAQCLANPVTDDRGYEKLYPENDAEWLGNDAATVEDIERAFNFARAQDPSVFQYLIMPSQVVWDAMAVQEKGLYLINAERTARGIKPYEGAAPEVATVAQEYADYILTRNQVIGHYNDGLSPGDRLDVNTYIAGHRDAHVLNESVAWGSGYLASATVDQVLVRAVFLWIYQDKAWFENFDWATGPAWGHRDHLLQTGLNENSGSSNTEGLIGFGVSRGLYGPSQATPEVHGYVAVFHTIDQNEQWNLATVSTTDTSAAQGCNTAHILDIDESLIETNGLSEIRVSPSTLIMVPGNTQPLQVMGVYDNGNQSDFTPYASFIADSRSIASVIDGVVTAEKIGQAQVFARINGLESNRLFVRVREATDISNIQGTAAEAYSEYVPDNASVTGYDPMAMAVYTGVVQDRNGQPLEGVQASFLNQPELGSTETDSNGRFIIAGPAGQQTIVYEMPGRLVIQRTTIGASNTWSNLEDVMLLLRDSKQTLIDLSSSEPQIHQSTPVNDEFGKRQATIVFNGITSATVLSADGSTRSLDSFLLSATEFETPTSMPGELPSEVAFTFANDLHVAGVYYSDSVVFDSDVVMFVDNFLGFDVGEIVPIGTYDRLGNQWVASSNGVVVQLLDVDGDGEVDGLDYTGDSSPDDLNGNGNTEDEVIGLAGYEAGDTLWWGSFNHFSAKDYNWGSSEDEAPTEVDADVEQEDEKNEETECTGSYVKPYQQTFHEDISIAGTQLTLHYSSQRTEGYKHKARIKVSGASIPSTLEQMIVKLEVAGRVFQRELAPATNTEVEFIWDGTRVDGVRPKGMVSGRVSIGYEYKAQYISAGNAAAEERELSEFPVAWAQVGDSVTAVPGRQNYISWQTRGVSFKNSFDRQLGNGWSLSNVHEFDPAGRVYLGNGGVVDVETQSLILKTGLTYSLLDGDDGYYQSGGSTIDYTVNDEAVLVDKVTGLEWQFADRPFETRSKAEAQAYCATEAEPKDSGWRLPTSKEVGYTIEKSGANIGPAIYSLTQARLLWRQNTSNYDDQLLPVMCVRGESIDDRYVQGLQRDAAQQVVVDKDNGLMWQDAPENALTKRDWAASIHHCEATTFAGFDDWRMPNINELLYVLPNNVFQHQSELVFPPGTHWTYQASFRQPYWSSTTNYQEDTQAWAIESLSFNSERFSKSDQYYVRCVRDAASSARMPYRFDKDGKHIATIDLDSGKTLVEFSYNDSDKLVGMTDPFGNHIVIERDINGTPTRMVAADGQVTELTVNEQNNLTALAYEDASQYQFFYQAGGLLTEKVDPNGYSYPHEFDENGRVYQTRNPEGGQWDFFDTRVGIGHDKYGYTTAEGEHYQTVRRVLENGDVRKEITYKNGATLIDILRADQLQQTTTYGGVTTVVDKVLDSKTLQEIPSVITITQPSGRASVTSLNKTYGQNGADTSRYTLTTDVNGDISTTEVDTRAGTLTQTSAEGRVVSEVVDPDTLLTQSVSVAGLQDTVFAYDTRGRLTGQAVGTRSTTYQYGSEGRGQVTAITAADGRQTVYEYDSLGRVTKVTYPDGHATLSEYDANGNQTTLVVPTPAEHVSTVNGINRVTSDTTPLGEATHYEYDRDRRLTAIALPSGQRLENTYSQNRLTQTNTPEGSILYSYHHGDQLSQISEGTETLAYTWDGSLLKEVGYQGELNEGIQYDHNANFQISQLTYAGDSTNLTYDRDGLLTGIHGFTLGRDANHGLPISLSNGTLNRTFAYNGYGEVTNVSTELNQTAAFGYELTYNSVGQITGKTETLPNGVINEYSYTYDDRYRLTGVTKNSQLVEQYQYDANGNRTLATSTERGVNSTVASYNLGDQLQSQGNTHYSYDGNGRLSQKTTSTEVTTYNYDSQGRLKQVQTPDHTIQYRHNALGNRVAKLKDGQVIERYLWQDKITLLATYDGNGNLKQRFSYTLGHAPTSFTENGNTYYLLTDQLGSPRVITDNAGQVVKAIEYDAYGNVIADSNPSITIPFGFAGGLKDDDTGLIRFGYRDYDPKTGRWTARDPIGFAGGDTNLYGYVLGDPVNWIDPTGLQSFDVAAGFGFAGGRLPQSKVEADNMNNLPERYNLLPKYGEAWGMVAAGGGGGGGTLLKFCKIVMKNPDTFLEIATELAEVLGGDPSDPQSKVDKMGEYHQHRTEIHAPGPK